MPFRSYKHLYASLIALMVVAPLGWASISTIRVGNPAPNFVDVNNKPTLPTDGGYEEDSPLKFGEKVSFSAIATDANGDDYYLAVCKTDKIKPNSLAAPTCIDGTYGVSELTSSGLESEVVYTVDDESDYENQWYAFVCDHTDLGPACSNSSQGNGANGSPFYAFKKVGTLQFGENCPDIAQLNELKKDEKGQVSTKKALEKLDDDLSKREVRQLIKKEVDDSVAEVETKELKLVEQEIAKLKKENVDLKALAVSDEIALADSLIKKRERLKKMLEKDVHFCITFSNDDRLENVVGKADKKSEKKLNHEINNNEVKLSFEDNKDRTIKVDFLQKDEKPAAKAKSSDQVKVESKNDQEVPLVTTEAEADVAQAEEKEVQEFKTITLTHKSIVPQEDPTFIDRLLGRDEDPLEPIDEPDYDLAVIEATEKESGKKEEEMVYQGKDNRKTDTYKYINDPRSAFSHILKNYTLYQYGTGKEAELYTFENVVLYQREDGYIEGYSILLPDLPVDKNLPPELINRASRFLAEGQIRSLHEVGGDNPDFLLKPPFVVDRNGNVIEDVDYEIVGQGYNQVKIKFEVDKNAYPLVLDPTIEFTAPGTSNVADSITGAASSAFASSIAVGDLNNDGKNDVAVGASSLNTNDGAIYVFYQNEGFVNTYAEANLVITGEAGSAFGSAVAIGDIDGDGDDDLIASANNYNNGGAGGHGRLYIFENDGAYPASASTADTIITGEESSNFGEVIRLGDLDGDGDDDIASTAKAYNSSQGRAYLFYNDGAAYAASAASADVVITGESTGDQFGHQVIISDLDSDGDSDLALSSPSYNSNQGRVYLFYNDGSYSSASSSADVIMTGAASTSFGYSLASGDFDNNQTLDLAVGASSYDGNQGGIFIFNNDGSYPTTSATADTTITGETNSGTGSELVVADLNGDGRDDLIASGITYSLDVTGRVYILNNDGAYPSDGANSDNIITGEAAGNAFGEDMAVGDINGDGFTDLLVGSNQYSSGQGRLYFFYAEGSSVDINVPLTGQAASHFFTSSLTSGDFNQDGAIDLAVGAPGANADAGEVYLFYNNGKSLPNSDPDVTIVGSVAGGNFGDAMASGDIDFDGDTDLVVSAPASANGDVYIFYNDGSYPANSGLADDSIAGSAGGDEFGTGIAIGDIDADGDVDIVAGAPGSGTGLIGIFYNDGAAYPDLSSADDTITGPSVASGFGGRIAIGDVDLDGDEDIVSSAFATENGNVYGFYNDGATYPDSSSADFTLTGPASGSNFGLGLALGDIDSDLDLDVIVGAPAYSTDTGIVYIYKNDGSYGASDDSIAGITAGGEFGSAISVGDIDRDGQNDLIISAPEESTGGVSYVFYNSASYSDASSADLTISGDSAGERFGSSLITADFNADGIRDLFIGADGYNTSTGRLYPFYGKKRRSWTTTYPWRNEASSTSRAGNRYQIESWSNLEAFAHSIATGDFNGDGLQDIAVGAPDYNSSQGRVYLFFGDGDLPRQNTLADVIITGSAGSDFGSALAANYLSENSDHYADLLVGAPGVNTDDGAAYLFNGRADWTSVTSYSNASNVFNGVLDSDGSFGGVLFAETDLNTTPDGRIDFAVSAPNNDEGAVYVYYNDGSYSTSDVTYVGETTGDEFGLSIASADLSTTPDGKADLLIGAPAYSTNTGRAYLFYNDGNTTADVTFTGGAEGDELGAAVATGELSDTPDARKDAIIGSPGATNGNVGIYFNDGAYGAPDNTLTGDTAGERFGQSILSKDLNRDGDDDLIVGSGALNSSRGYVQVFYNNSGVELANDGLSPALSGSNFFFGSTLVTADITGDGWNDLLVGAYGQYNNRGSLYIYDYGTNYFAGGVSESYGRGIATGDFDGDGDIDLAIGSPDYNGGDGRVVIFLQDISSFEKSTSITPDLTLSGNSSGGFGFSLSAGQVGETIDTIDDLVIGSPTLSANDGAVYIFEGGSSLFDSTSYSDASTTITGVGSGGDYFGYSVLVADDLNTTPDAKQDLLVGAPETANGTVYLYYGDGSIPTTAGTADVTLNGAGGGDDFGASLATGLMNSDYRNDIIVGSPSSGSSAGRVDIFYNDGSYGSADVSIDGAGGARLGLAIATGDLDDDGDDDLAMGAPTATTNQGAVYIAYQDGSYPTTQDEAEVVISGSANLYFGQSLGVADFDGDGDVDLSAGAESVQYFYFNDGSYPSSCCSDYDLAYSDSNTSYNFNSTPRQIEVADLTNDGKPDFLVSAPGFSTGTGTSVFYQGVNVQCEPPTLSSVTIVDTDGYTNNPTPDFSLAFSGNGPVPDEASFSCDGGLNWSSATSVSGLSTPVSVDDFNITTGATGCSSDDGAKSILVRLKNSCGYKIASVSTDSTTYDISGPVVSVYNSSVTGADEITVTATTTDDGAGAGGPYTYQFSGQGCTGSLPELAYTGSGDADNTFTGLSDNTQYAFKVRARDVLGNEGDYTVCGEALYSSASIPGAPIISSITNTSLSLNPVSGGTEKEMAIYVEEGATCDGVDGVGYLQGDGTIAAGSVWQSDGDWSTVGVTGLTAGTQYSFCAKARNNDDAETAFGSATTITTNSIPAFSLSYPSDGGSVSGTPTNAGTAVTFSADVDEADGDSYWLLVCKNNSAPTIASPPECNGGAGNRWARSPLTTSDLTANATYTTSGSDAESNVWYAFVCDQYGCSSAAQGSGNNGSPFAVNHQPTFGAVSVGDTSGGAGSIEPGDTIYFNISAGSLSDSDVSPTEDTINMYICDAATTSFDYATNTCVNGSLICSDLNVNFAAGDNAECDDSAGLQAPVPTTHGSKNYYVYVEDNHSFAASGTNAQSYTVQDIAPTLISYVVADTPNPAAGGSDTFSFSARLQDDNGENDITLVEGYFFDDDEINLTDGACALNEKNCYLDSSCSFDLSYGDSSQLEANCDVTFWFNGNASSNWEVHVNPTDDLGKVIGLASSNSNISNPALSGLSVVGSIDYGELSAGSTSPEKSITIENAGNTAIDLGISGSDLSSADGGSTISRSQQKWSSVTGFSFSDGYSLVETPDSASAALGCYDANMPVRTSHTDGTGSDTLLYWLFQVPSSDVSGGAYTGTNTISTLTCDEVGGGGGGVVTHTYTQIANLEEFWGAGPCNGIDGLPDYGVNMVFEIDEADANATVSAGGAEICTGVISNNPGFSRSISCNHPGGLLTEIHIETPDPYSTGRIYYFDVPNGNTLLCGNRYGKDGVVL